MSYLKAKMHRIRFRLGQTSLEELTALPLTPYLDLRGLLLREREGREVKVTEGEFRHPWAK